MIIYRNYTYIIAMLVMVGIVSCSKKQPESNVNDKETEKALFKIADNILEQTEYDLPDSISYPPSSRYNAWMYQNLLLMEGMDNLYEATGEEKYRDYSNRNIDYFAAFQTTFGDNMKTTPSGRKKWYTQPTEMWQCGMIAKMAERQVSKPNEEFERGMAIFDTLLLNAPKFEDGTLVRMKTQDRGLGVQIDDLYMLTPYWCRKAILTGDDQWLDRAIHESLSYHDYLWNEEDQLMKCLWLLNRNDTYGLYWGRGNGWYIMALTDLLEFIPVDHPKRESIRNNYKTFIDGIIKRQDKDGLWHQLLNNPESFTESSCTGMFTYCILKGVNKQWLDASYLDYGIKGWEGLQTKVNESYQIMDVCPPSDMSEDPSYYLVNRKGVLHDQHGIGPFILAGSEYLKATVGN